LRRPYKKIISEKKRKALMQHNRSNTVTDLVPVTDEGEVGHILILKTFLQSLEKVQPIGFILLLHYCISNGKIPIIVI